MKKTYEFEWTGRNENRFRIEASCERTLQYKVLYADGDEIQTNTPELKEDSKLVVFMNGKEVGKCIDHTNLWYIIDLKMKELPGYQIIWAVNKIAFTSEVGSQIHAFLDSVIDRGTQLDARLFQLEKNLKFHTGNMNAYQDVLKKCEAQIQRRGELPDEASAKKEMRDYNYFMNEGWDGGTGYVPRVYSIEDYRNAQKTVAISKDAIDALLKEKEKITANCAQIYTEKEGDSPAHFSLHPTQQDKIGKLYILPVGFHVSDDSDVLQILDSDQKKRTLTSGINQMTKTEVPMVDDYKLLAKENVSDIPEQHVHRRNPGVEL